MSTASIVSHGICSGATMPTRCWPICVSSIPAVKYAEPSIGRVITAPEVRGSGLGRALMREGLAGCAVRWPGQAVRISAQARLQGFYAELGFSVASDEYLEDGIPHLEMLWRPT